MAESKNWNEQFIDNYEKLRLFLHPVSYGCFVRKDICQMLGFSERRYHQLASICLDILPRGILDVSEHVEQKAHQHLTIKGDYAYGSDNFLAETYAIKSLTERDIFLDLLILRVLNKHSSLSMSVTDVYNKIYQSKYTLTLTTVKNHLQSLAKIGLIHAIEKGKQTKYLLAPDYFQSLSDSEIHELLFAIDFYKNISVISVPGYYLASTLRWKDDKTDKREKPPIQYYNHDIRHILENDLVYQLLQVINKNQQEHSNIFIYFEYRKELQGKWEPVITKPVAIIINRFLGDQQQLLDNNQNRYPLSRIRKVRIAKDVPDNSKHNAKNRNRKKSLSPRPLTLKFHYKDLQEKQQLQKRIENTLPQPQFKEQTEGVFLCTINALHDYLPLSPLLRTFLPNIEIPETEPSLRQRMQTQIEEAFNLYVQD